MPDNFEDLKRAYLSATIGKNLPSAGVTTGSVLNAAEPSLPPRYIPDRQYYVSTDGVFLIEDEDDGA